MRPLRSVRSKTLALSLAACLLAACLPAVAQQESLAGRSATVSVKDAPLAAAFAALFASAHTRYTVTPAAQELMQLRTVTANLEAVRLDTAIHALLSTVRSSLPQGKELVATIEKDAYVISVGDAPARMTPVPAPAPRDPRLMKPVTLHVHNAPLPDVLGKLVSQAGVTYRVHPKLDAAFRRATVSLDATNEPLSAAVSKALLTATGLQQASADYADGEFQILPAHGMPSRLDLASKRATVHAANTNAGVALSDLLQSSGVDYAFCNDVFGDAHVSLDLTDAPVDTALAAFTAQIPGEPKPDVRAGWGVVVVAPLLVVRPGPEALVTIHVRNVDVRYAIKALFSSVNANYMVDRGVAGTTTLDLFAVPFTRALKELLRATPSIDPLAYHLKGDVYEIAPQPRSGK